MGMLEKKKGSRRGDMERMKRYSRGRRGGGRTSLKKGTSLRL